MTKKVFIVGLLFALCLNALAGEPEDRKVNRYKRTGERAGKVHRVPEHGGWLARANGIEESKVNFGFQVGGVFSGLDASKTEHCVLGGKGSFFIHGIVPKTKTFAIGVELTALYMLTNKSKYERSIVATDREGYASDHNPKVQVGNWLLPMAQLSFMGNFHPLQRFNIQIKGNIGAVAAVVPLNNVTYYMKDAQPDGTYTEATYAFEQKSQIAIGFAGTVGTDFLYAMSKHSEFKIGLDFTYIRFRYERVWTSPVSETTKELTQFGTLGLHLGFAFNF